MQAVLSDVEAPPLSAAAEDVEVSVVMPCLNEARTVATCVHKAVRCLEKLGIRTAEVRKGSIDTAVEAVGNVAYDERDVALVQARGNGFVEKLYVRAPLDPVRKGQRGSLRTFDA